MLADKLRSATAAEKLYVDDVFSTWLYTGSGSTQTITNGIDLAGKGGLVWQKVRAPTFSNAIEGHIICDSARGASNTLLTNTTSAQNVDVGAVGNPFSSSGFTSIGYGSSYTSIASWTFRRAPKFFDVQTISHTNGTATNIALTVLGTVGQVVAKITNTTGDWITWHRSLTAGNNLRLNTTAAQTTTNAWLSVSGTTATLASAAPTGTYVIYAWAHDTASDGMIQCGSFTTDGSNNATVNLGWEPQFVLYKSSSNASDWEMLDTMRGMPVGIGGNNALIPNRNDAETNIGAQSRSVDPTATGFTARQNASWTFIYLAIRRPNKPPTSGTEVFSPISSSAAAGTTLTTSFPVDLQLARYRTSPDGYNTSFLDRLRGVSTTTTESTRGLSSSGTAAEYTAPATLSRNWGNAGFQMASYWAGLSSVFYNFRRAPGFFDVVCYTGNNTDPRSIEHSLGVVPELIIIKQRNASSLQGWFVFAPSILGMGNQLLLNSNGAQSSSGWSSAYLPTSSVFRVTNYTDVNGNATTHVAYLFASLPGISKVGSYTGNGGTANTNGTSQTINCGFSAGARFVLIKRTDSTGDWFVFDTARGIVAGNDPYLLLNSTTAEVTTVDAVDTDSTGFVVNQTSGTNLNVTNATYIYLAIA